MAFTSIYYNLNASCIFYFFFQLCRELLRRQACAAAAEKLAGEPAAALELSVACRQPRGAHREWCRVGLPCLGSRMSLSLHSDSENSSSSDQHGPVFESARVLPDSPTPYTDATQVCKSVPSHIALQACTPSLMSCLSFPFNRIPSP